MKRISLIIAILCFFLINAEAKKIQGIIITTLDTMEVTLRVSTNFFTGSINYPAIQNKVRYIDKNGKKKRIRADEAKEVRFTYKGEDIRLLAREVPIALAGIFSNNRVFLRLKMDGPLRLFTYYSKSNNPDLYNGSTGTWSGGGSSVREITLLQKGDGMVKNPNFFKFRKDMMEYLNDCPDLVGKLEKKDFKRRDVFEMVGYYNSKCK